MEVVQRIITYIYKDSETMEKDIEAWLLPPTGHLIFKRKKILSHIVFKTANIKHIKAKRAFAQLKERP